MYPIPHIAPIHAPALQAQLQSLLDHKTKPLGSLGLLENLALRLGLILGSATPELQDAQILVYAADHGLAAHGVSAYPSDVTWQMVQNFLAGGAAINVLARQHELALQVVDCGVQRDFASHFCLLDYKVAHGSGDSLHGPAMSAEQCQLALDNGAALLRELPGNALILGEMGIGNTSAASLLMARLCGLPITDCTGAGTGLDADAIGRKAAILQQVLDRHANATAPLEALAAFGGLEIATMVGSVLAAAAQNRVIVVDGFITTSAVLVAAKLQPAVLGRCVFAHCSGERGHALMLEHLDAAPLLQLGLRLGEGSGAALAWPLLVSACAILREMASFESAGIAQKT
ncbi:MAG: nicotinate-nucleotide--dimethylbenzimidazole phosphoribosyltransferase [Brachymonas sp.]|jgi:nicotinate-nucleotide--dimethylbenzimidazole phosphoribosyltransferase